MSSLLLMDELTKVLNILQLKCSREAAQDGGHILLPLHFFLGVQKAEEQDSGH